MMLKILIAEDDRHTRKILEHIFTKDPSFADKNVQLFLAPDGEEAMKLFEKESPDLVISDLLMPKLDGFALCRAIRKTPQGKDVPLIVTSAIYKETALLNRMRDELKVEFFAKPFQVRELLRGVQRMLEHRPGPSAETKPKTTKKTKPDKKPPLPQKGNLKERPLADLIFTALETKATGQLTLRRGRIRKEIFFILGSPIGAESNVRNETIGHYLAVKRILDSSQQEKLLATAREKNLSLMQSLVTLEWLSEEEVLRHHTALVKVRIINSLRWNEGSFSFHPGDEFSEKMSRCAIEPATIVLLGLKRVMDLDDATTRLQKHLNRPLKLTLRGERYRDVFIKVFGEKTLNHLTTHPSVEDLIAKGLNTMTAYTHVMALLKTGMASFGKKKRRPSTHAVPSQDPLALDQLKNEASREKRKTKGASDEVIYQELFGVDEISVVTSLPESGAPEPADSGVVEIPSSVDGDSEGKPSAEDIRKLVVSTYFGIHSKNYYEILEIPPEANQKKIDTAYRHKKEIFTVEKYSDVDLGTDHPKLEEILHLVEQSYKVLTDPRLRKDYDERLKAQSQERKPDPLEAELFFREGEQKLKQKKYEEAYKSFKRSQKIDPAAPDYHAYLAWARYLGSDSKPSVKDSVLESLQAALDMNPDLISGNLFAGIVCEESGELSLAITHLEKVLDQDPSHEEAFEHLFAILEQKGDWRILERQHRKVLHRLGKRFPKRSISLWKSLSSIYENKLDNRDNAKTCVEIALDIAPEDEDLNRLLKRLSKAPKASWSHKRKNVIEAWRQTPKNLSLLGDLFERSIEDKNYDAAFICASCLQAHGANTKSAEFYRRFRPPFLQRARRPVDDKLWELLRSQDDDPQIEQLFKSLSRLPEEGIASLLVNEDTQNPITKDDGAEVFFRVLNYLCYEIGIPSPSVYTLPKGADGPVKALSAVTPKLGISEGLLQETDEILLACALAPQIPSLLPGRSFAGTLPSSSLKTFLMGTMLLVAPKLKVKDPSGEIHKLRGIPSQDGRFAAS